MGSKLSLLAAIGLVAATTTVASADKKALARQLFELGIEEYKTQQWDAAAASMGKSYALDPQPNALYALAQSERLGGNCKDAVPHYQKLLETAKDEATAKAVKPNLELCRQIERGEKTKATEDKAAIERRDAPILQIKTVYRTEQKTDKLAIAMFAIGGTALGGSVAMYLVARSTRNDADRAQTLEEYNDLYDRAARLRWMSYAAAGLGVSLVGVAAVRIIRGSGKTRASEVAVVPISGGSMVSFASSW